MPIPVPPLTTLDQAAVDQTAAYIAQRLAEYDPAVDARLGVVHDIVQHLHAVLETAVQTVVDTWGRSNSLLEIEADPAIADAATVDQVLSNYRVERRAGAPAAGQVVVVLDGAVPVTVPRGAVFTARGRRYTADAAYAARTTAAAVLADTDRLLTPSPGQPGRYQFTISVTAADAGLSGAVRRLTRFAPDFSFPHFADGYAAADFAGGADAESTADLIARLADGAALKTTSSRETTAALVRTAPAFAAVTGVSEVGFGDPEQTRYHGLLPVAAGGRRDVFVRTAPLPLSVTLEKTAALVSTGSAGTTWQVSVGAADAPGFYEVTRVAAADADPAAAGFAVAEDVRGVDLTGWDFVPDVETAAEAAYSPFQTAVVRFTDDAPPAGPTMAVTVTVAAMPQIADLQTFLADRARRPAGSDILVRAAVPCFCRVGLAVRPRPGDPSPDATAIAAAVAGAVNDTQFPGLVPASAVLGAAAAVLPAGTAFGAVDLMGRIRRPDGTTRWLPRSGVALEAPAEATRGVSRRTVAFYLDPADVAVAVEPLPAG